MLNFHSSHSIVTRGLVSLVHHHIIPTLLFLILMVEDLKSGNGCFEKMGIFEKEENIIIKI